MDADPRYQSAHIVGLVSEYDITAQVLQEKVNSKKISDAEAKLMLAQKRAELEQREKANAPVQTHCNQIGYQMHCTTY